jgi:hypothetical protein
MTVLRQLRGAAYPWVNLLLFKLSWLLLVLGQERGLPWALVLQGLSLALHPSLRGALLPGTLVAVAGICLDSALQLAGLLRFPSPGLPAWLLALWFAFAFALPQGLGFLRRLALPLQALTGFVLGPLSYGIGERLGAVDAGLPLATAALLLGLGWMLFLPLALRAGHLRIPPTASVVALLVCLLLPGPVPTATATETTATAADAQQLVGKASLRWFLRPIYDAYLYAGPAGFDFLARKPFTFALEYRLDLSATQIVRETLRQWQKQQVTIAPHWEATLQGLIPDVRSGDRLALQVDADQHARLLHNDIVQGRIDDPSFVQAFAGIWLAEDTTRPDLRQQLLGLP